MYYCFPPTIFFTNQKVSVNFIFKVYFQPTFSKMVEAKGIFQHESIVQHSGNTPVVITISFFIKYICRKI